MVAMLKNRFVMFAGFGQAEPAMQCVTRRSLVTRIYRLLRARLLGKFGNLL